VVHIQYIYSLITAERFSRVVGQSNRVVGQMNLSN
jgi:hypothetical protein